MRIECPECGAAWRKRLGEFAFIRGRRRVRWRCEFCGNIYATWENADGRDSDTGVSPNRNDYTFRTDVPCPKCGARTIVCNGPRLQTTGFARYRRCTACGVRIREDGISV